jgi:hypothetical protein
LYGIRAKDLRYGLGIYFVDTPAACFNVSDENDNAAVSRSMRHFQQLTGETGATGLLVHHEGKSGEGAGTGRAIRGASALFAGVDQALLLGRQPGPTTHRTLRTLGRYENSPVSVVIALDGSTYQLMTAKPAPDEQAVLTVLTTTPQDRAAVAKAAGLSDGRASTALEALVAKGQVVRKGAGVKGDPFTYGLVASDNEAPHAAAMTTGDESWDDPA